MSSLVSYIRLVELYVFWSFAAFAIAGGKLRQCYVPYAIWSGSIFVKDLLCILIDSFSSWNSYNIFCNISSFSTIFLKVIIAIRIIPRFIIVLINSSRSFSGLILLFFLWIDFSKILGLVFWISKLYKCTSNVGTL